MSNKQVQLKLCQLPLHLHERNKSNFSKNLDNSIKSERRKARIESEKKNPTKKF